MRRLSPATLCRDLALHLRAGAALPEAVEQAARRSPRPQALQRLAERLRAGAKVSQAAQDELGDLPALVSRLVACGEEGEDLSRAFEQAARHLEAGEDRRFRVAASLAYPKMVITVLLVLVGIVVNLITPVFRPLFQGMHLTLPLPTRISLALASPLEGVSFWVGVVLLVIAGHVVLGGLFGTDGLRIRLPWVGSWLVRQWTVLWLSWMDFFVERRVPLDEAVRLSARSCPSQAFQEMMEGVAAEVSRGSTLSAALGAQPLFPGFATWLVGQAEAAEFPAGRLAHASDALRRDVDMAAQEGLGLLEPLVVIVLGCVVGFMVLSFFLPLYQLIGTLS